MKTNVFISVPTLRGNARFLGLSWAGTHTPSRRNRALTSPSPPPRGRHHEGHRVIVEQVIKKMSAFVQDPTFTRSNYNEWALMMQITGLANSISVLGGSTTEAEIMKKLLQVVPEPLEQVEISIETLLDNNDMTIPLSLLQSECVHLRSNLASGALLRLRTYTDHIHGKEKKEQNSVPPD
jgi:hypothetical protein